MKSDSRDFILLGKTYKVVCRAMCVKLLRALLLHCFRNSHQVYTSCETFAPNSFVKSTLVHFVNINLCLRKYLSIKVCLASSICKTLHITFHPCLPFGVSFDILVKSLQDFAFVIRFVLEHNLIGLLALLLLPYRVWLKGTLLVV